MKPLDEWLAGLGMSQHVAAFREADIGFDILPDLTDADLQSLGLTLGQRKRLLKAIADLSTSPATAVHVEAGLAEVAEADLEQRQVSVLYCDLVGSTALSERFDPEDLHGILRDYRRCCTVIVGQFGGFVTSFQGDGILIRFGYPQAHEDDAERAVACGLELATTIPGLAMPAGAALHARLGVATGLVVVGDRLLATLEHGTTGDTPNLAARLQGVAEPGCVVVDQLTHRLTLGAFKYRDLGPHPLRGFAAPVGVWQAVCHSRGDTRFATRNLGRPIEMIGREHELGLLLHRWKEAQDGEGRVMLLSGEAGIGKSRLVAALLERMPAGARTSIWQCSAHHVNTALFPALDQLTRAAGIASSDLPGEKLDKLEQHLGADDSIPGLASMLGVPTEGRYKPAPPNPAERRQRCLEMMLNRLRQAGEQGPVCFIVEDVHWIDPTSLELLELGIDLVQSLPVLIVVTSRPEVAPAWGKWGHVSSMTVTRLNRKDSARVAEIAARGVGLPQDVLDEIVERADGVPLFLEELARSMAGSAAADAPGEAGRPRPPIPSSLQGSLIERLDRLSAVKDVAQVASVIGREIPLDLLSAVVGDDAAALEGVLEQLAAAEIMYRRRIGRMVSYVFKHSLIQDAAYGSLLRARRRRLHAQVSDALESHFPDRCKQEPEMLAKHLMEAGQPMRAAEYWLRAAEHAIERSANREAVSHTGRGLDVVAALAESPIRDRLEIGLQKARLGAANHIFGFSSDAMESICLRLRHLHENGRDVQGLYMALYGEYLVRLTRSEVAQAAALADTMVQVTQEAGDRFFHHHALRNRVLAQFFAGNVAAMGRDLAILNASQSRLETTTKSDYSEATAHAVLSIYNALHLWCAGRPDEAQAACALSVAAAEASARPNVLIFIHLLCAVLAAMGGETERIRHHAQELATVGGQDVLPNYTGASRAFHAIWLVSQHRAEEGCVALAGALETLESIKTHFIRPLFLTWLGIGLAETQGPDVGLRVLDEAERHGTQTGELVFASIVHCAKGRLLLQIGDRGGAEAAFRAAFEAARTQDVLPLQGRAATALSEVLLDDGRPEEGAAVLASLRAAYAGCIPPASSA